MSTPERGRCVCGCPHAPHQRPGRGTWCHDCGRAVCARWVPLAARDTAILTAGQQVALARSDAQVWRTLWALHQHTLTRPRRATPIPAGPSPVYLPPGAIPAQRVATRQERIDAAIEAAWRRRPRRKAAHP